MTLIIPPKNRKMTGASCQGIIFSAPEPFGQLLCKTANTTYGHYPIDKNLEIGTKCRIMCGDSLPVPEYTYCGEYGWDINSTDMYVYGEHFLRQFFYAKKHFLHQKTFFTPKLVLRHKMHFLCQNLFYATKLFLRQKAFFTPKSFFCAKKLFLRQNVFTNFQTKKNWRIKSFLA